jgi:hypothetical protein
MSIGLTTKIAGRIEVDDLIQEVSPALRDVLNLSVAPPLRSERFDGIQWQPLTGPHQLDASSPLIGVSIQGEPEMASISIYERTTERFTAPDWKPEELGKRALVEVCGVRTGLSFALVAAVSLAIARRSGELVSDEIRFYSSSFDSSPEEFLRSTRLRSSLGDYRAAATQFERKLIRNQARGT